MPTDTRRKNANWKITSDGLLWSGEQVASMQLAVLMDIRDELQALNRVFACPNFQEVPHVLRTIRRNTAKPRKAKA